MPTENRLLKNLIEADNYTLTENLALTHKSTLSATLDFFATCGALRSRSQEDIYLAFDSAFEENPLYALRTLFYCRDIRGGLGERRVPRLLFKHLAKAHPEIMQKNMKYIPEFGRWDDLFELFDTAVEVEEDMLYLIKSQLRDDLLAERPSLLGKWMPSENTSSPITRALAKRFWIACTMTPKKYRKMLAQLRAKIKIVEREMCQNHWDKINYEAIPSRASMIYRKAFGKHDEERYKAYLEAVKNGEKKINTATLYPYDLTSKARREYDETIELQWKNLPNYIKEGENSIAVCDTSGSMTWTSIGGNVFPIDVATSLAIYFAERNTGPWKDYFMTFSHRPTLMKITGSTLKEKVHSLSKADCGGNTDIQAVFDLIFKTATNAKITQKEMLSTIYIISDMEFDVATTDDGYLRSTSKTNYEVIKEKYTNAGYEMPKLVFWNVQARNAQQPITINDKGVYLVSGCSPSIFQHIMASQSLDATEMMLEILNKPRYENITV